MPGSRRCAPRTAAGGAAVSAARAGCCRLCGQAVAGGPFAAAAEAFAGMIAFLGSPAAAGMEAAEAEVFLRTAVREAGRRALQGFFDLGAGREPRLAAVTGSDQVTRRRAERDRARTLGTLFGDVRVARIAYRRRGAPDLHPADGRLNLPPARESWPLQKLTVTHAAKGSYQDAAAAVDLATGQRAGKRQAEQMMAAAAADYQDFYDSPARRPPPGTAPGDVLALSCDAKGIVMLPGQLRARAAAEARRAVAKQDGRLSRGEVRSRKRMAETGAVFDITPVPRSPAQIMNPPAPGQPPPPAPRARRKWVTASVAQPAAAVVAAVFAEADRRDPGHQRTWIALADGNCHQISRIHAEAAARGITITIICDFIHVTEYLWNAAWALFPEASPRAGPWVRHHATAVLHGRARDAAAAIRAQAAALPPAKRRTAARAAAYLDAKAPWLDYPQALAAGWPISSGVIEGTCRHLVKDRMAITGARWTVPGAEAVLKIRSLITNNDFDTYWTYHQQRERQRNHDSRYHDHTIPDAA
jgi:hypothetical protein